MTTAKVNNIPISQDAIERLGSNGMTRLYSLVKASGWNIIKGQNWPLVIEIPKKSVKTNLRHFLAEYDLKIKLDLVHKSSLERYSGASSCCSSCDFDIWMESPKKALYYICKMEGGVR